MNQNHKMKIRKFIIIQGIPGSGKSTWCKNHVNFDNGEKYISRDEIRFHYVKTKSGYFSKEQEVYREFVGKVSEALSRGETVYADQTSLTEAARRKLIRALPKPDEIHVIFLNTPLSECIENNKKRTGLASVPMDAIYRIYPTMKRPMWSEGIKYLHIITNYEEEEIIDLENEALEKWSL